MKTSIILIFIIFIILVFKYLFSNQVELIMIKNEGKQQKFLVRRLPDKFRAAQLLCDIKMKLIYFSNNLLTELKTRTDTNASTYYKYVDTICKRLNNCPFNESSPDSVYTSYTVNKGDEMIVCLRDSVTHGIHDFNTLMYVCTHEIGHIGCPEVGHTYLFHQINKFLLLEAMKYGVYTYTNYKRFPCKYCSLILDNTIIDNNVKV
jgi:hypothetical protein